MKAITRYHHLIGPNRGQLSLELGLRRTDTARPFRKRRAVITLVIDELAHQRASRVPKEGSFFKWTAIIINIGGFVITKHLRWRMKAGRSVI